MESGYFMFSIGKYQISLFQVIQTLLIFIVLLWTIRLFISSIDRYLRNRQRFKSSSRLLIVRLLQIILYFVAFLIILSNLGIDLTALAIFSGTIGIGLGFGLQKIASNFISGIILSSENAIKEGDLLELNDGTKGYVKNIRPRHILLEGFDNKEIMVPNEEFINTRVTNWTLTTQLARLDIPFGVAYGTDLRKVKALVEDIADNHPDNTKAKESNCYVTDFADSSINFILHFWMEDVTSGIVRIKSEILLSIWETFEKEQITVPFPQRDIHILDNSKQPTNKK
ncbi:mechanosensitive ion channel family protein [Marinicella sp. W31]|uniref:mechanosensitive ion channel family protein n=1 Tax=Marinicella sp. W31 TaxID=3023713 RepID=UPI00375698BE